MTVLYFDTCSLAKRYCQEPGHRKVKQLIGNRNNTIVFSSIGIVEMSSVVHKKIRRNDISDENGRLLLARFITELDNEYDILSNEDEFLNKALGYIRKHDLRTLDAIHLATAKEIERQCMNFIFVSSDKDLIDAAQKEHMNYLHPGISVS